MGQFGTFQLIPQEPVAKTCPQKPPIASRASDPQRSCSEDVSADLAEGPNKSDLTWGRWSVLNLLGALLGAALGTGKLPN